MPELSTITSVTINFTTEVKVMLSLMFVILGSFGAAIIWFLYECYKELKATRITMVDIASYYAGTHSRIDHVERNIERIDKDVDRIWEITRKTGT